MILALICALNASATSISFAWNPNPEFNIAGYKIYYGSASRSYSSVVDVGNRTTFTVTNLPVGRFYFALTAYSSVGVESDLSSEVIASTTGFRYVTNSIQVATSLNGPWTAIATYVTPLGTNQQLFVRDELRIGP